MVAPNRPEICEIFIRSGQLPLGKNSHAKSDFNEIHLKPANISKEILEKLYADDVFTLASSYGNPAAGDPCMFDFLSVKMRDGSKIELNVFNLAILMFTENTEETRRLFRIINAIKYHRVDASPGA
jgi:hypothetical protein